MIGLVMNDEELIQRALYGLEIKNGAGATDNDGGAIQIEGQNDAGFMAQVDHSLSPSGYYTEGPYYQRYAMYPYLIFAQALANKKPELKIFEYRDGVLIKAVYALLDQTNTKGEFYPINDAVKGMSILSRELINAVSLAYHFGGHDEYLLPFIEMQDRVPMNDAGMDAAVALTKGNYQFANRKSVELGDGANGDEGALGILRSSAKENEVSLVMKYTKQGMGHGHFDKLSFIYYHNAFEVFQDYGSARWVNIEQKDGGGYLKENKTWAKQTIAHNTLVVNNQSQYLGNTKEADKHHSDPYLFDVENENIQVMSAKENNAYPDVKMHRTMVLIKDAILEYPIVLDLYKVLSDKNNNYDFPFYFHGQVMTTNFEYQNIPTLVKMGEKFGYQHLWKEAEGKSLEKTTQLGWFNGEHFYTLTTTSSSDDELIFGRTGASDPNFNLRRDPVFIVRKNGISSTLIASTFEVHGDYSPVTEIATNSYSKVASIEVLRNDEEYSVVEISFTSKDKWTFVMTNKKELLSNKHKINLGERTLEWTGGFYLFQNN